VTVARDLLLNLIRTELTARYRTATFGMLWFLLNPALTATVLMVVFQGVIQLPIERYPLFLLAGLLPWTFFQMGLANAVGTLARTPALVKRVRLPRALLPTAAVLASLVHFVLSLALIVLVLLLVGQAPGPLALLALILVTVIQVIFLIGFSLAAASLNVVYRDVEHIVGIGLRLAFWVTPIFYPLEYIPERWRGLALLNPMTGLLDSYRTILLQGTWPAWSSLGTASAAALGAVVVGVLVFRRVDPSMDDYV
jgi:ABC-type polysaccharide/polyol phosphate export permease